MESLLKNPHEEARARIIWGESWVDVHHWLVVEGGLTEEQATTIVQEIKKERAYEIRRSGLRSIRTGVLLLLGGAAIAVAISFLYRIPTVLIAAAVVLIVWGIYKIGVGILRAFTGTSPGSLTEMD